MQEGLSSVIELKYAAVIEDRGAASEGYLPAKNGYDVGWNTKKPRVNYLQVRGDADGEGYMTKAFDYFSWLARDN